MRNSSHQRGRLVESANLRAAPRARIFAVISGEFIRWIAMLGSVPFPLADAESHRAVEDAEKYDGIRLSHT